MATTDKNCTVFDIFWTKYTKQKVGKRGW